MRYDDIIIRGIARKDEVQMDTALLSRVNAWLDEHRREIIDDLIGLVRIPSVSQVDPITPPYGQACRDALTYMFELGKRHGYTSRNYDNYVGSITFNEGDQEVGLWAHLDVVPVPDPEAWDYPPFEGTLVEDRYLIGRGVQDNKAPAIGVFHVMNCLRDLGVELKHEYALYMGTSEETGMEDARYFVANYPCPDLSIVPDTGFPVCVAQRGAMVLRLSVPLHMSVQIEQSNNISVTPEEINVSFPQRRKFTAKGHSAHAYAANGIQNAVLAVIEEIAKESPVDAAVLKSLHTLCAAYDGKALGIDYQDELSGALGIAPTRMGYADGQLYVDMYGIVPVTCDADAILARAQAAAGAVGVRVGQERMRKPCSFPTTSPIIPLLTQVYNDVTGADAKPFVMSGGNYAAYLPNALGFGPGMPGREYPPHIFRAGRGDYHQRDESEDVEHILAFMRVYAMSIVALEQIDDLSV